jgi:hypothetical protein
MAVKDADRPNTVSSPGDQAAELIEVSLVIVLIVAASVLLAVYITPFASYA